MAASFIKKSDGDFYLRLTGDTTQVKFAAVSEAGNTYKFNVAGYTRIHKFRSDVGGVPYPYTESANPPPNGGTKVAPQDFFIGAEELVDYPGSGTRDFLLSYEAFGEGETNFYLGGESLSWGNNLYAYPGSGYLSNSLAVGVKQNESWKNAGNMFIKYNGSWREITNAYIKQGGGWKKYFQNFGNSSWINMLELTDDAIDFAVQVIPLWTWPNVGSNGSSSMYSDSVSAYSSGTSSAISPPATQSVTLYIELQFNNNVGYASMLLRKINNDSIIWNHSADYTNSNFTETFDIDVEQSYRFESITYVPAGNIGTATARVRLQNSQGTIIYSNFAEIYSD
jgi:hypothetical protein